MNKKQEAKIAEYREEYKNIGLCTDPCNRPVAELYVSLCYKKLGYAVPKFRWCDSFRSGAKLAAQILHGRQRVTRKEISQQKDKAVFAQWEAAWMSQYAFINRELGVKDDGFISIIDGVVRNCGVFWTFDGMVVMSERPTALRFNGTGLHNTEGKALEYKDGTGVYCLYGKRFPSLRELKKAVKKGDNK